MSDDDDDCERSDARPRRCMAEWPKFHDLDLTTQAIVYAFMTGGPPGVGMIIRGWWSLGCALGVSSRTAQRLAERGELIVAREVTPHDRGRVWASVGEVVTCARMRAGLGPYVRPPDEDEDETTSTATDAADEAAADVPRPALPARKGERP